MSTLVRIRADHLKAPAHSSHQQILKTGQEKSDELVIFASTDSDSRFKQDMGMGKKTYPQSSLG